MFTVDYENIRKIMSYDKDTGLCSYLARDLSWFKDTKYRDAASNMKIWNLKNADKNIGYVSENGYIRFMLFKRNYILHRLIWLYMTGEWPDQVDHINGIRSDNRWENLRNVTKADNNRNQKRRKDNSSGFTGVYKDVMNGKWISKINVNNKCIHLGRFSSKQEAVNARIDAEFKFGFHASHGKVLR